MREVGRDRFGIALAAALLGLGACGAPAVREAAPPVEPAQVLVSMVDTLRGGESLGELFERHGIAGVDLLDLVRLMQIDARRMQAGEVFEFEHTDQSESAYKVTLRSTPREQVSAAWDGDAWNVSRRRIRWDTTVVRLEGRVETSLYEAMETALASEDLSEGERIRMAWDLADVFQWQVDFTTDLQPGDDFVVVFERERSELGDSRLGDIVAGELEVAGRPLEAFRFASDSIQSEFYDRDGQSLRRAFLRAPVEFRRISSGFTRSRRHPVLGTWRRHTGIDFAADVGTPVRAAGDGQIAFLGRSGGYGRMVEIRHKNGITTRYAHLSAFGRAMQRGSYVIQGDVIGYVGSTGLASGPHLHYEFRQAGVARDPRLINIGTGEPIAKELRPSFLVERDRLVRLLHPTAAAVAEVADGSE